MSVSAKTYYLETFGCQMNVHDSEKVRGTLAARGYTQVQSPDEAGLVLFNTCSIRDKAEQKVFSRLAGSKKNTGGRRFGVLGCVAQHNGEEIFELAPHVNLVCGSASYNQLPSLLERLESGEDRVTGLSLDTDEAFDQPSPERDNPYSAFLTIIEGCDKACAYCVVPFTRGPERSRSSESVMAEARRIAAQGTAEIMLLGQTVNSYRDPSPAGWNFARLLREVGQVEGIRRVRFTTSHPRDFTQDIVDAIAENPTLCDWVHLPVQSGSTKTLRAMRRGYTREDYLRVIDTIKSAKREIALSTDIIVGFPGETEADFEETLTLMQEVGYASVFSFKYSPRRGTDAIDYADQAPEEEKGRRLMILQELQRRLQKRKNEQWVGRQDEALVEGRREKFDQWIGRTTQGRVLNFSDPASLAAGRDLRGAYCRVNVTSAGPNSLVGELAAVERLAPAASLRVLQ
ncbi:MAG: tRNA (N6-isopentenyl adenosine(37)-C2)-methylthiotransferase MiaB [Bryobacterales bacterium]|nr:tRNA (N6-isopentenyl adenosine(37)-C2)-methylthiotransferase MiaB [Bryobacterales bacterium]